MVEYGWDQTPTPDLGLDITKAPADIQKLYKWVIEKTYGEDVASAYGQGLIAAGIIAKNAEAMSLFTSGKMDTLDTFVKDTLIELTDKDIISAPEIIFSRDGEATLGDRLDRDFDSITKQLSKVAVPLFSSGEDDSSNFIDAVSEARRIRGYVYLVDEEYQLSDAVNGLVLSNITGRNSKVNLAPNVIFKYDSDITIEDIRFVGTQVFPSATTHIPSLITPANGVSFVVVKNVRYETLTSITDGSYRGRAFIEINSENVSVDNFTSINNRTGMSIRSDGTTLIKRVDINNFHMINCEHGLYIGAQGELFTENITVENITLLNTESQSLNFSRYDGADLLMFERVKNVRVNNLTCEYPVERAVYINVFENVIVENVFLNHSQGVKTVGFVDKVRGIHTRSKNSSISNVLCTNTNDGVLVIAYEVDGLNVDGLHYEGDFDISTNNVVLLERTMTDVTIKNISGRNAKRGVVQMYIRDVDWYDNRFKNITIKDINFVNPTNHNFNYPVIFTNHLEDTSVGYIFEDIFIDNVHAINRRLGNTSETKDRYNEIANTTGLIDIDRVNGLTIENSSVWGIKDPQGGLVIGENSQNVYVDMDLNVAFDGGIPNRLNVSGGSKIRLLSNDNWVDQAFTNDILCYGEGLRNLADKHFGTFVATFGLPAQDRFSIPMDIAKMTTGHMDFSCSNGEYMRAIFKDGKFTKIDGSANAIDTLVAGNICLVENYIRNRFEQAVRVNLKLTYTLSI